MALTRSLSDTEDAVERAAEGEEGGEDEEGAGGGEIRRREGSEESLALIPSGLGS